jgi:hypothetical protein
MKWDIFVSHASEDKEDVAGPLADMLQARGFKVWYDTYTLSLGDNIRQSIETGLSESQFAVVILSPSFFAKKWTNLELDGLFALEKQNQKRILPVWHKVSASDVEAYSSFLAMRRAAQTFLGLDCVAGQIEHAVRRERDDGSRHDGSEERVLLHPHSFDILEAAKQSTGTLMVAEHMNGLIVRAGDAPFDVDSDPRKEALILHSLNELLARGLIEQQSESCFAVTQEGFDFTRPDGVCQAQWPELPALTPPNESTAKDILQSAVTGNGLVGLVAHRGGETLQAGSKAWESNGEQRPVARWKSVLCELVDKGLLQQTSEEMFRVSHLGYLWTDKLNITEQQQ